MIILIPDLGEKANPESLHEFVTSCMNKNSWLLPVFRRKGRITKCEILRIKDRDSNQVEYQGLVFVDDDMTGMALIKQLHTYSLKGHNLHPRVYQSRTENRERRVNLVDSRDIAIVNRRRIDRRRSNLLIERFVSSSPPSAAPF